MYKYQHLYVPILYGLLSLRSRLLDVFDVFLKETNGPIKVNQISLQDKLRQASSKLLWLFWRYYLTFHIFGMDNVAKYGTTEQWPMEWAVLQIKSSADYSHGNWLMTYLSGALNYQVIHHLFPGVSQYLYPEIAPIFLEVCKKYNLKYNLLPGFKEVLNGYVNHLKNMSKQNAGLPKSRMNESDLKNSIYPLNNRYYVNNIIQQKYKNILSISLFFFKNKIQINYFKI